MRFFAICIAAVCIYAVQTPATAARADGQKAWPAISSLLLADAGDSTLSAALGSGNATGVTLPTLRAAAQAHIDAQIQGYAEARRTLYGLNADGSTGAATLGPIDWDPTTNSSFFTKPGGFGSYAILPGNWRYSNSMAGSGSALGVVGQAAGTQARYAAFGGNPMAVRGNGAMDAFIKNTIAWLTPRSKANNFKVVTAHLPGNITFWFPHEPKVRTWLTTQFPGVMINGVAGSNATDDSCDGNKLDACLQGADLLVIGRQQGPEGAKYETPDDYPPAYDGSTILTAVARAQSRGIPVLYFQHHPDANDLGERMQKYLGLEVNTNYWAHEGAKGLAPANLPATLPAALQLQTLLQRLDQTSFIADWSQCNGTSGRVLCEYGPDFAGLPQVNEIVEPAKAMRMRLRALDTQGLALFAQSGYTLEKLLVLMGDKYREAVRYPMKKETAGIDFFRAYFSDMAAYINRPYSAIAPSLGNFSGGFAANTATLSRMINTTPPKTDQRDLMTGLYVMPGRTVTLTRSDASNSAITVGINMLRDTTRLYNSANGDDGYNRPTMLASPRMPLVAGQHVTLTSPFGGPLFLFIGPDASATPVKVQIDGVITHPILRDGMNPTEIAAFKAELASTSTNWVGVSSEFLTIHSKRDYFKETLADYGSDVSKLFSDLSTYMVKDTYGLAGFSSATGAFSLPGTVAAFCNSAGWDCTGPQHRHDIMQHLISDNYALCGAGCSGNPYDQNWPLEPLGWGETHEIGHGIQPARLKIYGGQSGEVSNNIYPTHKLIQYNRTLPATPLVRDDSSAKAVFDILKAASVAADPLASAKQAIWADTSYAANNGLRVSFYRQLVEYARFYNINFNDGWELFTLMNLLNRNFAAASGKWLASASGLGFGSYTTYPSSMDGNDFMLITSSRIIGRDMRPVFSLWGISTSAAANAQVAAFGLTAADKLLFPMKNVVQFGAGVGAPITVSPSMAYPAGF